MKPLKITKKEFDAAGGLTNSNQYRKQLKSGRWVYYRSITP